MPTRLTKKERIQQAKRKVRYYERAISKLANLGRPVDKKKLACLSKAKRELDKICV